jgi:hypothetical protein
MRKRAIVHQRANPLDPRAEVVIEELSGPFTMVRTDELFAHVTHLIAGSERPKIGFMVFHACIAHLRRNSPVVAARSSELAEWTKLSPSEVRYAMSMLTRLGILTRLSPGHYALNPRLGWNGDRAKQKTAVQGFKTQLTA